MHSYFPKTNNYQWSPNDESVFLKNQQLPMVPFPGLPCPSYGSSPRSCVSASSGPILLLRPACLLPSSELVPLLPTPRCGAGASVFDFLLRNSHAKSEGSFGRHSCGEGAAGIWWAETRDASGHRAGPRTAPQEAYERMQQRRGPGPPNPRILGAP